MILISLFYEFFIIGIFAYGGGLAMLPLLQEIAIDRGWLTVTEFTDLIAISQSTPGPIAINLATFIGYNNAGVLGALVSSLAVILPAFILALIIARFLQHFNDHPIVKAVLVGLKAAVIGLILTAVLQVAFVSLYTTEAANILTFYKNLDYKAILLFFGMFFAVFKYKKHPIVYITIAGILGVVIW
jgi:chromate transporter